MSSCEKSFSGDELSAGDLDEIQGNILSVIKKFDDLYNKHATSQNGNYKDVKDKKRQLKENQRKKEKEEKKRKKVKREDSLVSKVVAPVATMPF